MKKKISFLGVMAMNVVCLLIVGMGVFVTPESSHAADCINSYQSGTLVESNFGAAWNPFGTQQELLIQGQNCSSTQATLLLGGGANNQYVYKDSYVWDNQKWSAAQLGNNESSLADAWYKKSATANITLLSNQVTYAIGYVCQYVDQSWKCGCKDQACAQPYWQLQGIQLNPNQNSEKRIAAWGDSLTAPTQWPEIIKTLFSPSRATYNGGVGGQNSTQIATRQLADTDHKSWVTVIWAGRNNFQSPETVKTDIAKMIEHIKPNEHYLVMSILNADVENEWKGNSLYAINAKLNSDLAALYPNNFLDIRSILVAAYNPNNSQDVIDHQHDIPPSSLRKDHIHLNTAGQTLVAQKVRDFILQKGW